MPKLLLQLPCAIFVASIASVLPYATRPNEQSEE